MVTVPQLPKKSSYHIYMIFCELEVRLSFNENIVDMGTGWQLTTVPKDTIFESGDWMTGVRHNPTKCSFGDKGAP